GGHGGDGLPCAITGEEVWYAGGGGAGAGWNGRGGYAEYGGKGGKGGGANGSNRNSAIPGYSAPDGFGGGGGGGSHSPQTAGGNGGAGTVIVSVMNCDPTDAIPDLDRIGVDETTEFTATLKYNILNLGEGETAADVTVEYGFGADSLDFTAQFPAVDTAGRHELVLEGLSEATTYYARITLAGRNSGAEGRSGLFVFTTAAGTAFPDAFGLFEVKLEGGANAESDLSLIEYGDADTQLHKAATALGKFYSADGWTAGETWAYKGYMFFKANQRLDFVSGQHGFSYIKIEDTVYLNETGNHDGRTCTWAGTNQEDLWLPVEFRVGCAVGVTPGPNSYQLKFLRDLNWNENWIYIPENLLRLYTGSAIDISSATIIGDTIHANIAVHDPRIFGETLYVRHGSDPDARESWDSAEIVDGSFEIGQGDTYYQVYATAGDVEYPSAMTAVSEARVLGAENPEVTYAGLSNVTFGGADVNFSVVSTGSAATTDVTVEYGTLPDRLEYSAAAAGLGAGPGTISLSGLVPETDYYFIVSTVNGAGAEGVDSALATFRTAADPTGAFESDEDAIQIGAGFSLDGTGGDTVAIAGTLLSDGGGARVYAIWSGDASFATASTNELSVADGAISGVISGLSVSTRYYVRLYAEGGAGYFATPARQVATSGAAVISSTWTGSSLGHVDIYFSLDDVGAGGSVAVTLYIDGVEVETKNLSAAGIAVFSHQHATLGQHVYMLATSNTTALGLELDGATAETGYALVSNGAYYWRGAKGGLWSDAANWYCPQGTGQGMADCGYPDNASATVFFQGAAAGEVEIAVDGGYTVGKLVPYELDRSITLAGAAAGASLTVKSVLDGGEGGYEDGENGRSWGSTIEFADMGVAFDCEMVPPPGGRFVFRRCAVYPNFGYMTLRYTGSSAEFREGTTANFGYGIQIHSTNTKLVVDDSTLVCRDLRFPIFPSDTGNVIEFFGSSPKLQAYDQIRANDQQPGSGYDGSAAYVFHVPAGGYLSAPVEGMLSTTRFNEYEAGINFVIAADS
ncbi:MAG: hypothetical protein ILO34_03875, partial [Kiritimatiellae bacterium]|nr:hypothetical protein [Kiritimatiellia bacterium]